VLSIRKNVFFKIGGLILDDLDAEEIIFRMGGEVVQSVKSKFTNADFSTISDIIKDEDLPYHKFLELGETKSYSKCFENWVANMNENEANNIIKKGKWFYELIFFEMNTVFYKWYKTRPSFDSLSLELREYLKEKYKQESDYVNSDAEEKTRRNSQFKKYYKKIEKYRSLYRRFNASIHTIYNAL
jgi:hypothetical protein